jgi:hypothetical protein
MSIAWAPEAVLPTASVAAQTPAAGPMTPPRPGAKTVKRNTKAASSSGVARSTVNPQLEHGGVPPSIGHEKAGASGRAGSAPGLRNGGVPPASPAIAGSLKSLVPPPPPLEVETKNGPVPPGNQGMIFAGATMAGAWAFEDLQLTGVPGGEGMRHVFQVIIGDKAAADAWLAGPEGLKWLEDAKSVSLITFAVMGLY